MPRAIGNKKICSHCRLEKSVNKFGKNKNKNDGLQYYCKQCRKIEKKKYYKKHLKDLRIKGRLYYQIHKEEQTIHRRTPKRLKHRKLYNKKYLSTHKKQRNQKAKNKRRTDVNYRIGTIIRSSIHRALKIGQTKSAHTMELIGCDIQNVKLYLQWTAEQNGYNNFDINNYSGRKYNIDHIIPCYMFDLEDPNQQRECFNWKNLQILSVEDHKEKHKDD